MLRWVVALVLALNVVFLAWSQGWLGHWPGTNADSEREPERLNRQVRADTVQLLSPQAAAVAAAVASAASSPASTPAAAAAATSETACLQAGPFSAAELSAAEAALRAAGIAPQRWQAAPMERPGTWLLYMGKFADREALQKKETELQRIHVQFEELRSSPELEPGLSLGRFNDRKAADAALAQLNQHGVRTAKVITLTPPVMQQLLRIDGADAALQAQLRAVKGAALGSGFKPCAA